MDSDKLPPISPPPAPPSAMDVPQGDSSGTVVPQGGGSGAVVPLPPLPPLPGVGLTPPDTYFSVPAPLLPAHGSSVFLTATPDELFAGLEEMIGTPDRARPANRGPWRPPPAAYRVGSFIRNHRVCIHLRGCTKCREEAMSMFRERSMSKTGDDSSRGSGGGGGGRRKGRRSASRSGRRKRVSSSARSKSPGKKCSSLCVHPSTKGRRSPSGKGRRGRSAKSSRSPRGGKGGRGQTDGDDFPLQHGSEIELPTGIKRLTVYHNHDFAQMTWEELMALLTTNFRQHAELSEQQIRELEEIKAEILEKIEAGWIKVKDPRLRWKNREMMLTLQLTHLSRARDIYRAVWEALSEHNAHMRRLPTLLQVRAFREVHSFSTDFLKSGCTLLRFTQVPGRLCRGINLYQACLALVLGRRWLIRVLQRRLKRISDQTQDVNTAIDSVLQYKFQELPADRMRVSHLLTKLDGLTRWFEDVKSQMLETVRSLHADLEARRQRQVEEAIVATMDAEVDGAGDWKHLCDFNRCLTRLVEDMEARNELLRGMINETRSSARRRGRDGQEWHAWLLQQGSADGRGRQRQGQGLNISRTRWLPV